MRGKAYRGSHRWRYLYLTVLVIVGGLAGIAVGAVETSGVDSTGVARSTAIGDDPVPGDTVTVGENATYRRLQTAIDEAQPGDTI